MSDGTLLDPEVAANAARKIVNAATTAQSTVPGLVERVRSLCAGKPWGGDGPGQAAEEAFSLIPETFDRLNDIVNAVLVMGQNLQYGVAETAEMDFAARDRIVATGISSATPVTSSDTPA